MSVTYGWFGTSELAYVAGVSGIREEVACGVGARKNGARERDTRVSLAQPVLSCTHFFQAPATQGRKEGISCALDAQ